MTMWLPKSARDKWAPFRGNNHNRVESDRRRGGSVSFAYHLGQPLTDRLWEDLTERLCVKTLRIYGPRDAQWTDGHLFATAIIDLDESGRVTDIHFNP